MRKFVFHENQIKKVVTHYNPVWNYTYIEYIFNENFTKAFSIRIPQDAIGIKAMLISNNSGIEDEFEIVVLEAGGCSDVIFDIEEQRERALRFKIEELQKENKALRASLKSANHKLDAILSIINND